jgi:hypothetical protein
MQAERLDRMVTLAGCDKSFPGMMLAAARLVVASVLPCALLNAHGEPSPTFRPHDAHAHITGLESLTSIVVN